MDGQDETRNNSPKRRPQIAENVKNEPKSKKNDPQNPENRKIIERSGDAKISYPRLRLEFDLRWVGPPVQTRQLSVLVVTKNLAQLPSKSCSEPEKEEA